MHKYMVTLFTVQLVLCVRCNVTSLVVYLNGTKTVIYLLCMRVYVSVRERERERERCGV